MVHDKLEEIKAIRDPCGKGKKRLSQVNVSRNILSKAVRTDRGAYRIREIQRHGLRGFKTSSDKPGQSQYLGPGSLQITS